jgi:WD40 repeat protein/nucleoside phosphorylase
VALESDPINFRSERVRHETLLGRDDVLREIDRLLERSGDTRGWVLVKGGLGRGKSAILAHYLGELERQGRQVPHHFLRRGRRNWDRPDVAARNISVQVEVMFRMEPHTEGPPEVRLQEALQRVSDKVLIPRGERLLLIIDGLDEVEPGDLGQNPLKSFLPDVLPPGVRVLCSSRPHPDLSWLEAKDGVRRIDLDSERWAASNETVVRQYCEQAASRFEPPLAPELLEDAVRHARGNILYIIKLLDVLQEQSPEQRRAERLPHGLDAFLEQIWKELPGLLAHEQTVAFMGLGLIAAAREALPHSVLAAMAGWRDMETGERFLRAVRPFLLETPGHEHSERAWSPSHESFRAFISERLGVEGMRRAHRRLAEHLCVWPMDAVGKDFHRRYALRHGVQHWQAAGDWQQLLTLCTDVGYLEAKCQETEVTSVEEDLARAARAARGEELSLLRHLHLAVQAGSHWLREYPGELATLLYNWLRCSGWTERRIEETLRFPNGAPALRLRHPVSMSRSEVRTLSGHERPVYACAVTPDGRRAISASEDKTLKLWDLETGLELTAFEGHEGYVYSCSMTPDGRHAVSGSADKTLKVWDLESGLCLATLKGHAATVHGCAVTADGQRVVSASEDGTLRVWNAETDHALKTLEGHAGTVYCCAVSADGRRAFSGSEDTTLKVWDLETGRCLATLQGHESTVFGCAVTKDGRRLLSSSGDNTLKVWDLETGLCLATLKGHDAVVFSCAVTADGRRAVSASFDHTFRVWDLEANQTLFVAQNHKGPVFGCAVTEDGWLALSAANDKTLKVWDLERSQALAQVKRHEGAVGACAVTPDGLRAVSAGDLRTLMVWDLKTGGLLATLVDPEAIWSGCAMTPDGRHVVSASQDRTVKVWDVETKRILRSWKSSKEAVFGMTVTHDGQRLVAATLKGMLGTGPVEEDAFPVWDLETGQALTTGEDFKSLWWRNWTMADGHRRVIPGDGGSLLVQDIHTGELLQTLHTNGDFRCVSTAGDVVCAGDGLGNVWILEANPSRSRPRPRTSSTALDLGIVIALKDEFRVFEELLPSGLHVERDAKTGQHDYTFELPGDTARCVVTFIGEQGADMAALHAERLLARWNPRTVVMLGTALGIHPDVRVGDVIVASQVDDYLASAKARPGSGPGMHELDLSGVVYRGDYDFISRVRNLEFAHPDAFASWLELCSQSLAQLVPEQERTELIGQRLIRSEPALLDIHLASGSIDGTSPAFTQWLRSRRDRNLKALDMESSGLMASAFRRVEPARTLVIRGVHDYCDERRSPHQSFSNGALRRHAMHNATTLLWTLLRSGMLAT